MSENTSTPAHADGTASGNTMIPAPIVGTLSPIIGYTHELDMGADVMVVGKIAGAANADNEYIVEFEGGNGFKNEALVRFDHVQESERAEWEVEVTQDQIVTRVGNREHIFLPDQRLLELSIVRGVAAALALEGLHTARHAYEQEQAKQAEEQA